MNAQLGTDLTEGPTLGVQVGCLLNVHGATVASVRDRSCYSLFGEKVLLSDGNVIGRNVGFRSVGA